jgi:hypothetical protein
MDLKQCLSRTLAPLAALLTAVNLVAAPVTPQTRPAGTKKAPKVDPMEDPLTVRKLVDPATGAPCTLEGEPQDGDLDAVLRLVARIRTAGKGRARNELLAVMTPRMNAFRTGRGPIPAEPAAAVLDAFLTDAIGGADLKALGAITKVTFFAKDWAGVAFAGTPFKLSVRKLKADWLWNGYSN